MKSVPHSRGIALASLIVGLLGLILLLVFLFSMADVLMLWAGMALGLLGLILGIVALKKKQLKGMAVTGLVAGALTVLIGIALWVFALIFVGALFAGI